MFSTLEGIRSYLKPPVEVGVDPDGLVSALALGLDESDVRGDVVRAYRQGVKRNILALEHTLSRFQRMLYALMLGLVLLTAGALVLLVLGGD